MVPRTNLSINGPKLPSMTYYINIEISHANLPSWSKMEHIMSWFTWHCLLTLETHWQGRVIAGRSIVDESMLTGESLPVFKEEGLTVSAGTINWVRLWYLFQVLCCLINLQVGCICDFDCSLFGWEKNYSSISLAKQISISGRSFKDWSFFNWLQYNDIKDCTHG